MRRAARSTTANIAEGNGRLHYRDNYTFGSMARGSLFEVLDHLITAHDDAYISAELLAQGRTFFERSLLVLNGYMNYLRKAAIGDPSKLSEEPLTYGASEFLIPWLDLSV